MVARNQFDRRVAGLDFATVDYLGLSHDRRLAAAARWAADEIGVHTVSVGGLIGNHPLSEALEETLCGWLGYRHCVLFPTGWAASYGALVGLVRSYDFVVMDELAHASLQQGAAAATDNVVKFRHLSNEDAQRKIAAVRLKDPQAAICVVTEGMYSMDGDVPDLRGLHAICREHGACLVVDVCHDLAASGPDGTGTLGCEGLLGQADVVVGSFSKALGANGGFLLVNDLGAAYAVKFFSNSYTYSSAMSPLQVAVALQTIAIARSSEGEDLRAGLRERSARMRDGLTTNGAEVYGGDKSHIVPMHLGREGLARIAGGRAFELGLIATVIEFPVVGLGAARFRFSMKPGYRDDEIDRAVEWAIRAARDAEQWFLTRDPRT